MQQLDEIALKLVRQIVPYNVELVKRVKQSGRTIRFRYGYSQIADDRRFPFPGAGTGDYSAEASNVVLRREQKRSEDRPKRFRDRGSLPVAAGDCERCSRSLRVLHFKCMRVEQGFSPASKRRENSGFSP